MLWGLFPRWHGSWHIMLAFGQKAADIDESWYCTSAPLAFIWAVQSIPADSGIMDIARRRSFLREQLPNVRRVLEKKIAADLKNNNPDCAKQMYAILGKHLLLCCDYAGAKAALEKADPNDNGYNCLEDGIYLKDSRAEMDLEIALATGPSAEVIRKVDAAIESGDVETATKLYFSLRPPASEPFKYNFWEKSIVRLFLPKRNLTFTEENGIFALARYGSIPGVKAFLDVKYDVNARGTEGCTLLLWSLFKDWRLVLNGQEKAHADEKIAMLKFLMSRGADIHALSTAKWTAMHLAVSNQLPIQVLDFIAHQPNIDLNAGDIDMETPLIWCSMLDFPKHAQFLINHGADINRRDTSGKTALDHARSNEMRQILLDAAKPR